MSTLVALLVALVLLKLLVIWIEPRMAFFPRRGVQATPAAVSLSYEDLRIQTEDGETLHGWWLEHPSPRAQVIFWHGNGGNLSLWMDVIVELRRRGFSVLAVDYRGYGLSTGTPSEKGIYRDAAATVKEFARRRQRPGAPLIFWGRSIGCPVAASIISVQRPDAVVLESPMPDARSLLRANPVLWLLSFLSSYRFSTSRFLTTYDGPLLVIHGDADSIVPFKAGQQVFRDAKAARGVFVAIPGADHNDLHVAGPELYWRAIDDFVATLRPNDR
jgi:hypothetical protein